MSQADDIRDHALKRYVAPARAEGRTRVTIRAGDLCREMSLRGRVPNICNALGSTKFAELADVRLVERTGPRQSTTTCFVYAVGDASRPASTAEAATSRPQSNSPKRARTTAAAKELRELTVVIQCAASKLPHAGQLVSRGKPVHFVARPDDAPSRPDVLYRRPDDPAHEGRTWRDELVVYNREDKANSLGLLPAWQLYKPPAYRELVQTFGLGNVFLLSAGWGLLTANYPTPHYDITFSGSADSYKRRRHSDQYADFRMLPDAHDRPVVFLGGKDYIRLFVDLTAAAAGNRYVLYNSDHPPDAPGCTCIRFETTTRTNWHYECAKALIAGKVDIPPF